MDKKTAADFVARIETHRGEESAIWDEMRQRSDYQMNEDKTIVDILDAREKANALLEDAQSNLATFVGSRVKVVSSYVARTWFHDPAQ